MTDRDCLLAAIIETPECDTARLVFADWLEENAGTVECGRCVVTAAEKVRVWGDRAKPCPACNDSGRVSDGNAGRAEFIRVQVELAGMKPCVSYGNWIKCVELPSECQYCRLRRREQELLKSVEHHILEGLPKGILLLSGDFRQ